jgi:hypothetical protein
MTDNIRSERQKRVGAELEKFDMPSHVLDKEHKTHIISFQNGVILALMTLVGIFITLVYSQFDKRVDNIREDIKKSNEENKKTESQLLSLSTYVGGIATRVDGLDSEVRRIGTKLFSLQGLTFWGNIVFYKKPPGGHPIGKRVCALSTSYDWKCDRQTLLIYQGKTIYLSVEDNFDNSLDFEVVGFFPGPRKEDGTMIQIPSSCLAELAGGAAKLFEKRGVIYGRIKFP